MTTLGKYLPLLAFSAFAITASDLHADKGTVLVSAAPAPSLTPSMSVPEMQAKVVTLNTQIADNASQVLYIKEQAKKAQDVIKLSCVNDKLVQLKAQQNIAERLSDELQIALTSDKPARFTLYADLSSTSEAVRQLREEAASCIGEPELYKQESGGTFDHPPFPDDPLQNVFQQPIEAPAYCSPFT